MLKIVEGWSFTKVIALILMVLMGVVVGFGVISLGYSIVEELFLTRGGLTDFERLPSLFGLFLWVLVGLELLNAVKLNMLSHEVHVERILTVGIIAMTNHIIATDLANVPALTLFAVSAVLVALSVGYFIMKTCHSTLEPVTEHIPVAHEDKNIPTDTPAVSRDQLKHWFRK